VCKRVLTRETKKLHATLSCRVFIDVSLLIADDCVSALKAGTSFTVCVQARFNTRNEKLYAAFSCRVFIDVSLLIADDCVSALKAGTSFTVCVQARFNTRNEKITCDAFL
jgi:hypothetical protein